jgi:hypothetical protein
VGSVIVTEVLANAMGNDGNKEWLELLNTTAAPIDLQGWVLSDMGGDSHTISGTLNVPAGGRVVLAASTNTANNGGLTADYAWGGGYTLGNSDDEVILTAPNATVIDQVVYVTGSAGTFPGEEGKTMSLDPGSTSAGANDSGGNWCLGTASYGTNGDLGTPGAANPPCTPAVTDADGDGSPADLDCDDSNPAVHPGATEVQGNGIDDDCNAGTPDAPNPCVLMESEGNNSWTSADALALGATMCGESGAASDLDTFQITVPALTSIAISVGAFPSTSPIDTYVRLLDDGGAQLDWNDDASPTTTDSLLLWTVVEPGTYYVEVSDYFLDGGSTYDYALSVVGTSLCDAWEIESNDSWGLADTVSVGGDACGYVTDWVDVDWWRVTVAAGASIDFIVESWDLGTSLGAQLAIYGSDGSTQLDIDEPGAFADPWLGYTFATAGTYYIAVESDWIFVNDEGYYVLHVVP